MPNAKDAHSVTANKFFLLGDTGSGKTTQFLTLPGKKFIYLFDPNALLSLRGQDLDYEEWLPDRLGFSATSLKKGVGDKTTGLQNTIFRDWEQDFDKKIRAGFFDQYDAIGLDSATTLLDLIMDRVLALNGRPGQWPQQDDYGPQMLTFTNICRTFTGMGKILFMTGHLETKQDQLTQRILRSPMMTGRLRTKIPLLFSDIFIAEAENDGRGKVKHKLQTVPDRMTTCVRNSFRNLEPFEDVTLDWNKPLETQGIGGFLKR